MFRPQTEDSEKPELPILMFFYSKMVGPWSFLAFREMKTNERVMNAKNKIEKRQFNATAP